MKIEKMNIQLSGINLASIKEEDVLSHIQKDLKTNHPTIDLELPLEIFVNIEGHDVNAYYICGETRGMVTLQ